MTIRAIELSRRKFISHSASGLVFMPILARAGEAPPQSSVPIATTDTANRLSIGTMIAGNGPFRFVVDTGADRTVIAAEVAQRLGLATYRPVVVQGIAKSVDTVAVRAPDFIVGDLSFGDIEAPILPRAGIDADGYVGLDVLDRHRITLNFAGHELTLGSPRPAMFGEQPRGNEAIIRAFGNRGHLRAIDCLVDGIGAWAFIDSGAEVSVGNTALFNALANRNGAAMASPDPVELIDVTGGRAFGRTVQVSRVHLTGFDFSDSALVIADLQIFDVWGLTERPALFMGMNLLRQFARVTIDYGRKEFRFRLANAAVTAMT